MNEICSGGQARRCYIFSEPACRQGVDQFFKECFSENAAVVKPFYKDLNESKSAVEQIMDCAGPRFRQWLKMNVTVTKPGCEPP